MFDLFLLRSEPWGRDRLQPAEAGEHGRSDPRDAQRLRDPRRRGRLH